MKKFYFYTVLFITVLIGALIFSFSMNSYTLLEGISIVFISLLGSAIGTSIIAIAIELVLECC